MKPSGVAVFGGVVCATLVVSLAVPVSPLHARDSTTNLLVVYGDVFGPDGVTHWFDGDHVVVENLRTHDAVHSVIGATETGRYEAIFLDFDENDAGSSGDTLVFDVVEADTTRPLMYVLAQDDIDANGLRQDLVAKLEDATPLESVTWSRIKALFE